MGLDRVADFSPETFTTTLADSLAQGHSHREQES
jgi:hypothetical protein